MKVKFFALILIMSIGNLASISAPDYFLSGSDDTVLTYWDIMAYRKFSPGSGLENLLMQKLFSLEAYEKSLAMEDSLILKAIALENLYIHAYAKFGKYDFSPSPEYLDSIRDMSSILVNAAFICTKDSLAATKVWTELKGYEEVPESIFTSKTESLFYEYSDPNISGIAQVSWENVIYPLRDRLFSLDDFSVSEVIRFPTFYVVIVRLKSSEKEPLLPDTMNADWYNYITSISVTNFKIKSILDAIEFARPAYDSSTMDFFVSADSAKFDSIPFPIFPELSENDSKRIVCRYLDNEMTVGEMILRFKRKGQFPRLGDTANLRFEIERHLILEDAFTMPHMEKLLTDNSVISEIEFLQNEHLYTTLKKRLEDTIYVDIDEMRAFYERNIADYLYPERLKYSMFLVKDSVLADSMRILVQTGSSFDSLSRLHSIYVTADKGGDAGYRTREQYGTLQPIMQEMDSGETSELFKTIDGWAFVEVTQVLPPEPVPFDSIQIRLKNDTRNEKIAKFYEAYISYIKEKFHITLDVDEIVTAFMEHIFFNF
ncbi:peptidyl-prolyl cis-trans isomerase [candidate division WOR-3 bacterium]|nr:peptidyl-prolyl cis-trans isomerase [candidate division WOR-3 bacterium]